MSILIKGFPLPNNCGACPLRLAWCRERIYMVTRPERCPLVPVPPHGDLKDADELEVIGYCGVPQGYENTFDSGVMWLAEQIDKLPTIIPASEEGE